MSTTSPNPIMTPDPSEVQRLIGKIRTDLEQVTKEKHRVEELALYYQSKIAAIAENHISTDDEKTSQHQTEGDVIISAKRRRTNHHSTENTTRLQAELENSKAQLKTLALENRLLEEKLATRDRAIAADAKELETVRQENGQVHDLRIRLAAAEAELKAAEMRSERTVIENQMRMSVGEESSRFLQSEVTRLSEELTKARFSSDTAAASHAASLRAVNELNKKLSRELGEAKAQVHRMEDHVHKVELESSTLQSTSERETREFEEEERKLNQIVEIQKDLTTEAEKRVRDYEEIVKSLKTDIEKQEKQSAPKQRIAAHAEVLLKNLQDALDSRIRLLHQQKEEMERARAAEMSLLARQESLLRQVEDARWETEQAKKEMTRARLQTKEQAREIARLEKQLEYTARPDDSLLGLPDRRDSMRRSSGLLDPDFSGRAEIPLHEPIETPDSLEEVDAAVQELSNIRMRHQKLLMAMREKRAAYS